MISAVDAGGVEDEAQGRGGRGPAAFRRALLKLVDRGESRRRQQVLVEARRRGQAVPAAGLRRAVLAAEQAAGEGAEGHVAQAARLRERDHAGEVALSSRLNSFCTWVNAARSAPLRSGQHGLQVRQRGVGNAEARRSCRPPAPGRAPPASPPAASRGRTHADSRGRSAPARAGAATASRCPATWAAAERPLARRAADRVADLGRDLEAAPGSRCPGGPATRPAPSR